MKQRQLSHKMLAKFSSLKALKNMLHQEIRRDKKLLNFNKGNIWVTFMCVRHGAWCTNASPSYNYCERFPELPHQRENSLICYFCATKWKYFCITCMPNLNCNYAPKSIIVLDQFYEKSSDRSRSGCFLPGISTNLQGSKNVLYILKCPLKKLVVTCSY